MRELNSFKQIWCCDFEFAVSGGDLPKPKCMVMIEYFSGQKIRLDMNQLESQEEAPVDFNENSLLVAYYASAEISCFLSLNWKLPVFVLDLYSEFRNLTNGYELPSGRGLIGALVYFGLSAIDVSEKEEMRLLALREGDYTDHEMGMLLDYCESDVTSLIRLLNVIGSQIDIPRALFRGEYTKSVARIEHLGVPIDFTTFTQLRNNWDKIKMFIVGNVNAQFDCYSGTTFKTENFKRYLSENNLSWPVLESGKLKLDDETFKDCAKTYPQLYPLYQAREALSKLREIKLPVSNKDFRNRNLISPFSSVTGRNQPSTSQNIFSMSAWLRSLIKPADGRAIAYIDWSQQEFGIAAKLSGDLKMQEAYLTGDPYLAFAIQCGAAPVDATKKSHSEIRSLFKSCVLAVQYCMGEQSLALKINKPISEARQLLELHKRTYRKFWEWSDNVLDFAMTNGYLNTVFGWKIHVTSKTNPRTLRNFLMQANGAEMLRVAIILLHQEDINVCAPIHDAILIEDYVENIESIVFKTQQIMKRASAIVLDGFELSSDAEVVCYPGRYEDERGQELWNSVMDYLSRDDLGGVSTSDICAI